MSGLDVDLDWGPAPQVRRLATLAALTLLAALLFGRVALLGLAAPMLAALAAGQRGRRPDQIRVEAATSPARCVEGDTVELTVTVSTDEPGGPGAPARFELRLAPSAPLELVDGPPLVVSDRTGRATARWTVRPRRWGGWTAGTLRVTARDAGRLRMAVVSCPVGRVEAFPRPDPLRALVVATWLPDQIGNHTSRAVGGGVEFAGVRAYAPGDPVRDVNWPVSLRRGRLHVTQRAAERSAEVVVALDAFSDVGAGADTSLDRAVRGAAGAVQAYLRAGDRVGLIVLGGVLRWMRPQSGQRQLYRIVESVLELRRDYSVVSPDLGRVPRSALPPGALVVAFTPLLDPRAVDCLVDLRQRGHPMVVLDVLDCEPPVEPKDRVGALALRLWRLDRAAQRYRFGQFGVPVITCAPATAGTRLDVLAGPAARAFRPRGF